MSVDIDRDKLGELINRTHSLIGRELKTAHDAIPQVLNGAGLTGRTEGDKRRRYAYRRKLTAFFNNLKQR